MSKTLWISHRGESIDAPENTLAAFKLAMDRNSDGMETDIHFTADGKIVCGHDANTKRCCGVDSLIAETTFEDLQKLDACNGKAEYAGEKIPLFSDALKVLKPGKLFYVELKIDNPAIIPAMMAEIDASGVSRDQIVVISFYKEMIKQFKAAFPKVKALWLTGFGKDDNGKYHPDFEEIMDILYDIKADGLDANGFVEFFDADFVMNLQREGYQVAVWTIDKEETAKYYLDAKVDGITSNCAAKLMNTVK